jgi:asparagine synthase (glutamine-hydrolysing)
MDGDFGFGMRRLSIIDVAGGHQPITTPDGRHSIVFNGEIYNHLDLRAELAAAGFVFRTKSDTETLLAASCTGQDDAWLRLEGMYAVAIWDQRGPHVDARARPARHQAALHHPAERRHRVRLRDPRTQGPPRASIRHRRARGSRFLQFRSRAETALDLPAGRKPRPRARPRLGATGAATRRAFWQPRFQIREGVAESDWIEETRERVLQTVSSTCWRMCRSARFSRAVSTPAPSRRQ